MLVMEIVRGADMASRLARECNAPANLEGQSKLWGSSSVQKMHNKALTV